MIRKILRIKRRLKVIRVRGKELRNLLADALLLDVKVEMIRELILLGLRYGKEVLDEEVRKFGRGPVSAQWISWT